MRLHVGKTGNTKLQGGKKRGTGSDRIFTLSFLPIVSCDYKAPCTKDCYAKNICARRPAVYNAWRENLELYRSDPDKFWIEINKLLYRCKIKPRGFRFFVAGDFDRKEMVTELIRFAAVNPTLNVLAFTKRVDWLPEKSKWKITGRLERFDWPKNLSIVVSRWPGDDLHKKVKVFNFLKMFYPQAWMRDPQNPDWRIPRNAIECEHNCSKCMKCFNLKPGQHVVFDKH